VIVAICVAVCASLYVVGCNVFVVGGVKARLMWLRVCCLRCAMAVVWLRRCYDDDDVCCGTECDGVCCVGDVLCAR
jgi:hypothetical protein